VLPQLQMPFQKTRSSKKRKSHLVFDHYNKDIDIHIDKARKYVKKTKKNERERPMLKGAKNNPVEHNFK